MVVYNWRKHFTLIENLEGFDETDFKTAFRPNIYKYLKWFYNTHIRPVIIAFTKMSEIKSEIDLISTIFYK